MFAVIFFFFWSDIAWGQPKKAIYLNHPKPHKGIVLHFLHLEKQKENH